MIRICSFSSENGGGKRILFALCVFVFFSSDAFRLRADEPSVVFEHRTGPDARGEGPTWDCAPEKWVEEPRVVDAVFVGELEMTCFLPASPQSGIAGVRAEMEETLRRTRVIHSGPESIRESDLDGRKYDVTVALKDEGEGIRVREEAIIASDETNHLVYRTESREISAEGMASFLKKVAFRADVKRRPDGSGFTVSLWNRIEVARPWYAMEWVFTPIARKSVLKKFTKVRQELLPRIARSIRKQNS